MPRKAKTLREGLLSALPSAGLAAVAFFTCFFALGLKSFWLDEAVSADYAHGSLRSLWKLASGGDPNMSLYYFVLHFWIKVFGESETAIRSLSALAAVLAVLVLYRLTSRLFDKRVGLLAGFLLAINPYFIDYTRDARAYTLAVLFVVLAADFLVRELEQPALLNRVGYTLSAVLAVYSHYFAAFVLLAQLLTVIAWRRHRVLTRSWLGVAGAVVVLCLPTAWAAHHKGSGPIAWIKPPQLGDIGHFFLLFAGERIWLVPLFLAALLSAAFVAWQAQERWRYALVASWLFVPVGLSFLLSYLRPMFIDYYLIVALPALIVLVSVGLAGNRVRWLKPLLAIILLLIISQSAIKLSGVYGHDRQENWRAATHYVFEKEQSPDSVVLLPDWVLPAFSYYKRLAGNRAPAALPTFTAAQVLATLPQARLWVLSRTYDLPSYEPQRQALLQTLKQKGYRLSDRRLFGYIEVELYAPQTVVGSGASGSTP
jgi:mannosyltransferase